MVDGIEPVGMVLSDEQMPIGYDRRTGDKIWFNEKAPPGLLYAERDVQHLLDKLNDSNSTGSN